ncbi:MAG TPA: bacteriohopanetetrol glucosamine biosynthesis glycosyltransferase HpnI [Bryobacteraceae bacterium]|nr:bacteriohopanetetrol glucosamine biosynthesis glycosyltransferase HpnI [Bryobacteraceae bacterium]
MIWLAIPALAAGAYYLLVLVGAWRWVWRARSARAAMAGVAAAPPVSILKPIHGRDPHFYDAIRSHAEQDYPEFEILFGVGSADEPALEDIRRLQHEFPSRRIEIIEVATNAPNAKAGALGELAKHARCPVLLVNDSDISVEAGYLRAVTAPLANRHIGLVTCLYRARADSWPSRLEALGIATEFAPSVLAARLLGQAEFALGSTMVFRAATLHEIGGFDAIADYLADDYQLGRQIHGRGYHIEFAACVVETDLGGQSWAQVWRHQLRWSRTIRVSRPSGYFGYAVTHATLWALVALAAGQWWIAAAVFAVRIAAGVTVAAGVLKYGRIARDLWLIPLRDLFGFAVWLAGGFGSTVQWRDRKLRLRADGKVLEGHRHGES